jgi:SHS2 domain-containing protein
MPKVYEFFEHTADIGVHVFGRTLEELFTHAAPAMYEALGQLQKTESKSQKSIELKAASLEDLLHDWLTELLYEVEIGHVLYDEITSLSVSRAGVPATAGFDLAAKLRGSSIDFARSQANEEIKAVTYHQLRVEKLAGKTWRATVIFDV